MASEFIGYTILVTLKSPPPTQHIRGIVAGVVEQRLILKDGTKLSYFDGWARLTFVSHSSVEW